MKTSPPLLALGAIALALSAAGCEERVTSAPPQAAPAPSTAQEPGSSHLPALAGLGEVVEAGKTFRPTHTVIVWSEARQALSFHLYPFAPSPAEVEQVRRGSVSISFNKPSPDQSQWPDHCPVATYILSWARKPKEAVGALSRASHILSLYGVSQKNAKMSVNQVGVPGALHGKIAAGEQIRLRVKGRRASREDPVAWDLALSGQIQIPPPPAQAPKLSPAQKGKLGVVTFGDLVYKVEGALAKRDSQGNLARIALLSRAPTPEDSASYRAGQLSLEPKWKQGYVELYLFAGRQGFGSPPKCSQRKLILKSLTGPLATTSFFMTEGEFSLSGSLEVGQACGLKAKGLEASTYSDSIGKIVSWELNLVDLEVLEEKGD